MEDVPRSRVQVPGRVNLIGEHIDYHNLAVLPMALGRRIDIHFSRRDDALVHAVSAEYGERAFSLNEALEPGPDGDWANYVKAAARAAQWKWQLTRGVDMQVSSDLPAAAGLSSSSALLTACTLALLEANGVHASFEELMEVLPEGEHFVGTRGGGMDHAAVLGARSGCALLVEFAPVRASAVRMPPEWSFFVAHSLSHAEKSGAMREAYNSRRRAGTQGLEEMGFTSFRQALDTYGPAELRKLAGRLPEDERLCFLHVAEEALRVRAAARAMESGDAEEFGRLLYQSHESLRDQLRVSNAALDRLVEAAQQSGALGARLTGAGFGGCAVVFCLQGDRERIRRGIEERFYGGVAGGHLIEAAPSAGALELAAIAASKPDSAS